MAENKTLENIISFLECLADDKEEIQKNFEKFKKDNIIANAHYQGVLDMYSEKKDNKNYRKIPDFREFPI